MIELFIIGIVIFGIIDFICYALAEYPARTKIKYKLLGGGIIALYQFGRRKNEY